MAIASVLLPTLLKCKIGWCAPQQDIAGKQPKIQKQQLETQKSVHSSEITHQLIGSQIVTKFKPKNSQGEIISLDSLAFSWGYKNFNWVSYVVKDPYGITNHSGQKLSTPYNDPPRGGYFYDPADKLPFYWDLENCRRCKPRHHWQNKHNLKQFELVFEDSPADYRLQPGEAIEFVTSLVGIKDYDLDNQTATWEVLHTFRWQLTNPLPNMSQVSLIATDVEISQLSPMLLSVMQLDGAVLNLDARQTVNSDR